MANKGTVSHSVRCKLDYLVRTGKASPVPQQLVSIDEAFKKAGLE